MNAPQPERDDQNPQPPVFGSWKRWYVFILVVLVVQILLYTWLTFKYL